MARRPGPTVVDDAAVVVAGAGSISSAVDMPPNPPTGIMWFTHSRVTSKRSFHVTFVSPASDPSQCVFTERPAPRTTPKVAPANERTGPGPRGYQTTCLGALAGGMLFAPGCGRPASEDG